MTLDSQAKIVEVFPNGDLKIYASDGKGAYFKQDRSFKGFIEKQYE